MKLMILTPTYNRAYILPKLYESLCSQTVKEFEWIVVDDGSSDSTKEIVDIWIRKRNGGFPIRYFFQDNGGKHRAINRAMREAKCEWTFIVDSDDYLLNDAVESVLQWINTVDGHPAFAGVAGLRGYDQERLIGGYPEGLSYCDYIDATNLERRKFNLAGDKAEVYRTSILKQYPFPEFPGEKFLTERVVWDSIALDGYKIRWFNKIIYIGNYLEDGLTKKSERLLVDNILGYTESVRIAWRVGGFYKYRVLARYISSLERNKREFDYKRALRLARHDVLIAKFIGILQRCSDLIKRR